MSTRRTKDRETTVFDRGDLIGRKAAEAAREAKRRNLQNGISVVYAEKGKIYREKPNGKRTVIGEVRDSA